jgi:spermidine synthase
VGAPPPPPPPARPAPARPAPPPPTALELALPPEAGELRSLSPELLAAAQVFAPDRARIDMEPSTLMHPVILDHVRSEWRHY